MLRYIILLLIIEQNESREGWRYLKSSQAEKTDRAEE